MEVASVLNNQYAISLEEMSLLEVPVDILSSFPAWKVASQEGFQPKQSNLTLSAIGANTEIQILRLQLSPFSATLSAALLLLRRLLETLGSATHFQVAVEPGGNVEAISDLIFGLHDNARERVQVYELETSSLFAQDNARGAKCLQTGSPVLHVPRGFRQERGRSRDDLLRQGLDNVCGVPIFRSQLFWEGGNILHDGTNLFVGADSIHENMVRLGLTRLQVEELFCAEFGQEVNVLGEVLTSSFVTDDFRGFDSGQASFHIDLDLSLPGKIHNEADPVAMLASPSVAFSVLSQILSTKKLTAEHYLSEEEARRVIEFEYKSYAEERIAKLERYNSTLRSCGYSIFEVPDLRIDPQDNLFSTRNLDFIYCNVLPARVADTPSVLYLPYGIPQLDGLAEKCYRNAGCEPLPLSQSGRLANLLMLFRGGLRCACGQIK